MDQFLQCEEMIPEEERPADPVVRAELGRLVNGHGSNPEGNCVADIVQAVPNLFLNPDFALPIFFDFELADELDGPRPTESFPPLGAISRQSGSDPASDEASGTSSRETTGAGPSYRLIGALDNFDDNSTASTEVISSPRRDVVAEPRLIPDRADELPENQPSGSGPRLRRRSLRIATTVTASPSSSSKAKRKEPKPPVRHRYYLRRRRENDDRDESKDDEEPEKKIAPKKRKSRKQ